MPLIRVANDDHVESLCRFLREARIEVRREAAATLRAAVPGAVSPLHERREIHGYVTTWMALNPGKRADIVG